MFCPKQDGKECSYDCPWWDDVGKRCEVKSISASLHKIAIALKQIAENLPLVRK